MQVKEDTMEVQLILALIGLLPSLIPLIEALVKQIESATAGSQNAGESKFDFVFSSVWTAVVALEGRVESSTVLKTFATNWLTTVINKMVAVFNKAKLVGAKETMFVHFSAMPPPLPMPIPVSLTMATQDLVAGDDEKE
jgi:hypothetical protein